MSRMVTRLNLPRKLMMAVMDRKAHWENVYATKPAGEVSWYQTHAQVSLELIESIAPARTSAIIDVGGGASVLVDDLLTAGFANLTVLDISRAALDQAKSRLGARSAGSS